MRKGQELRARRYFITLLLNVAIFAAVLGMLYVSLPPDEVEPYLTEEAKAQLTAMFPWDGSVGDNKHDYFVYMLSQKNAKWKFRNYFIVKYAESSNLGVTLQAYPVGFWSVKQ